MAFVVETGRIVAGANSLVSVEFADDYFATHPYYAANWSDLTLSEKQNHLMNATSIIGFLYEWKGNIVSQSQALYFPRSGVYDLEYRALSTTTIPLNLMKAICEVAVNGSMQNPFETPSSVGIEEINLADAISVKFDSGKSKSTIPATASFLLKGLGWNSSTSRVSRADPA